MRLALFPAIVLVAAAAAQAQDPDETICARIFAQARTSGLARQPITEVVVAVARSFLGSPYEARTLDRGPEEEVVTNLRSFDCVTLVENVLALARCIKQDSLTFGAYRSQLETIRYRDGVCRGYESRLHYFSDWIADGERKGIVRNLTRELGGRSSRKTIDFMTSHRELYPLLRSDSLLRNAEARLSRSPFYALPAGAAPEIPAGAIIAIATSVAGLDVSHTGIAVAGPDGLMHLLHAPDNGDSVKITAEPLVSYARKQKRGAGIIVVLPLGPR